MSFRKVVEIDDDIDRAHAYVTADSRYQLFVNGTYLGRGPARCDPRWQSYDTYDLSKSLKKGRNVIAVLVHHFGVDTASYMEAQAGFLFQANIQTTAGRHINIVSDRTWKVCQAAAWHRPTQRVSTRLGFLEVFDANREPQNWKLLDFDDAAWSSATEIIMAGKAAPRSATPAWINLVERGIPMLEETEKFPVKLLECGNVERNGISRGVMFDMDPLDIATAMSMEVPAPLRVGKVIEPENGLCADHRSVTIQNNSQPENATGLRDIYLVVDFGTVVTGNIRIRLDNGVKGGIVDLGYAERLTDGRVVPNMGSRYADRYIMRDGPQTWEAFHWKAFRYVLLTFRNCFEPIKLDSVSINFTSYPVGNRGAFQCSDELLNKIWEASRYTMQLNMQDAFMDTAWREQLQWVEDARMELLVNYYAFGDTKLPARYLRQIAQSQQPDGMTASYYPAKPSVVADDCLEWVMTVWDYYLHTGDKQLLEELYPPITKLMAAFESRLNEDGMLGELPYDILFDIMAPSDYRGITSGLNAEYYAALNAAANMARVMDDSNQAAHYDRLRATVKEMVNRILWCNEKGAYADSKLPDGKFSDLITQMSNGMTLFAGIVPPERIKPMVSYIMDPRNPVPQASPFGLGYLLPALFTHGHGDDGIKLIRDKYGNMIREGATTIWEYWRYDGDPRTGRWGNFPRAVAHAGGTIVGYQLQRSILGVAPTKPGFEEFSVDPEVYDLQWAKGVVPSVKGDILVHWQSKKNGINLQLTVPQGSVADVGLPTGSIVNPQIRVNGSFRDSQSALGRVRVKLHPGTYLVELVGADSQALK